MKDKDIELFDSNNIPKNSDRKKRKIICEQYKHEHVFNMYTIKSRFKFNNFMNEGSETIENVANRLKVSRVELRKFEKGGSEFYLRQDKTDKI